MVPCSHRPDCYRHRLSDHATLPSHRYQPLLVAYQFLGDGLTGDDESWLWHDRGQFWLCTTTSSICAHIYYPTNRNLMQSLIISPQTVHVEQMHYLIGSIQQSPPTVLWNKAYINFQIRKAMTIAINKSMSSFQDQGAILLIFISPAGGSSSISSADGWPWFALIGP